jgi:hypothetical protein
MRHHIFGRDAISDKTFTATKRHAFISGKKSSSLVHVFIRSWVHAYLLVDAPSDAMLCDAGHFVVGIYYVFCQLLPWPDVLLVAHLDLVHHLRDNAIIMVACLQNESGTLPFLYLRGCILQALRHVLL